MEPKWVANFLGFFSTHEETLRSVSNVSCVEEKVALMQFLRQWIPVKLKKFLHILISKQKIQNSSAPKSTQTKTSFSSTSSLSPARHQLPFPINKNVIQIFNNYLKKQKGRDRLKTENTHGLLFLSRNQKIWQFLLMKSSRSNVLNP